MSRRGQNTTEYLLLLCAMVMLSQVAYKFLSGYIPVLTERVIDLILTTALSLAAPV